MLDRGPRDATFPRAARAGVLAVLTLLGAGALVVLPVVGNGRSSVAAAASDPVLVVAGDIACGPTDPNFGGGERGQLSATAPLPASCTASIPTTCCPEATPSTPRTRAKANSPCRRTTRRVTVRAGASCRTPAAATTSPGWSCGPRRATTSTATPTRTTRGSASRTPSNYYSYFGGLGDLPAGVTGPSTDFYSFDIPANGGTWHIVSLDSECAALPATSGGGPSGSAAGCATGSPQETFLNNDLATHQGECTLIHWHEPAWSEGANGNRHRLPGVLERRLPVPRHRHRQRPRPRLRALEPAERLGEPRPQRRERDHRRHRGRQPRARVQPQWQRRARRLQPLRGAPAHPPRRERRLRLQDHERHHARQRHDQVRAGGLGGELELRPDRRAATP